MTYANVGSAQPMKKSGVLSKPQTLLIEATCLDASSHVLEENLHKVIKP